LIDFFGSIRHQIIQSMKFRLNFIDLMIWCQV